MSAECLACGADLAGEPLQCFECKYRSIVERLATEGPLIEGDSDCGACMHCARDTRTGTKDLDDPINHESDCLWRNAVEAVA